MRFWVWIRCGFKYSTREENRLCSWVQTTWVFLWRDNRGTLKRSKAKRSYNRSNGYSNKTVLGYSFKTDEDLSIQLGKPKDYVSSLKQEGFSYKEIIRRATKSRTIKGYTFMSDRDLSRQLGKSHGYVHIMKAKHLSYEEIIKRATPSNHVGGYSFSTNVDLSIKLGKYPFYVDSLRKSGLSYEEIIKKAKE